MDSTKIVDGAVTLGKRGIHSGIAAFGCGVWPVRTDRHDGGNEQIYTSLLHPDGGGAPPADLDNRLRAVAAGGRQSQLSWTDVAGKEVSYRVYRSAARGFAAASRVLIGASGGPGVTTFTDPATATSAGVCYYKVRAVGSCGEEPGAW